MNDHSNQHMKTYELDVVLSEAHEVTDDLADELFAAGCDDATLASCDGVVWVHFDREAASPEDAIRSAVEQIKIAGISLSKVELDVDAAWSLGPKVSPVYRIARSAQCNSNLHGHV